jgi:putative ATP-dependent endonuclease of OLD family
MRLTKITIENFRGIAHAAIELHRDITVLIGENNVGKTSILEALRFCLDAIKSDKSCNFTEFDFYRDTATTALSSCQPIKLTLEFRETAEHPWPPEITQNLSEVIVGDDFSVIKLQVSSKYDAGTNELSQKWAFLDDADNEIPGKSGHIQDLRRLRPFFFQRALRSVKDEFGSQSAYWSSFLNNKDIDEQTRKSLEAELSAIGQKVVNAHGSFQQVADEVKRLSDLVAVGKVDAVSIDPVSPDIYKTLRYGTEVNLLTASNAKIPLRSHGEGTQSLAVLLLFSAYLKTRLKDEIDRNASPIIAIEEPEAHLHPSAIRAVWRVLKDLPGQKIVVTHSGDILSEVPLESIRRINRNAKETKCDVVLPNTLNEEEKRKFNHHVRRNRGELLFAKAWILVEGETDVSVLSECADLLNIDFRQLGIRVIECSQAGGPSIFIKTADALGIVWHLLADSDDGGKKYIERANSLLNGREESKHISTISEQNMDVLLCRAGFGRPYRNGVGPKKEVELKNLAEGTKEYWDKVYSIVNKTHGFSKPAAALEALLLMQEKGEAGVPNEIKSILEKVKTQVKVTQ